jgi:hypothetical protein
MGRMKLFAAIWFDTDNYTYNCDHVLGIYSSRAKADERCLMDSQSEKRELKDYHVNEFTVDEDWKG